MNINSIEAAYSSFAKYLLNFIGDREWDYSWCVFEVFDKMATGSQWLSHDGVVDQIGGFDKDTSSLWEGLDAAMYVRDDILRATGHRIWGLIFTLYPTGKFEIEYDYKKPEGYEETDEAINAREAFDDARRSQI